MLMPGGKSSFKVLLHLYALTLFTFIGTDNIFFIFKDEENSSLRTCSQAHRSHGGKKPKWTEETLRQSHGRDPSTEVRPGSPNQSVMELVFQPGLSRVGWEGCAHQPQKEAEGPEGSASFVWDPGPRSPQEALGYCRADVGQLL